MSPTFRLRYSRTRDAETSSTSLPIMDQNNSGIYGNKVASWLVRCKQSQTSHTHRILLVGISHILIYTLLLHFQQGILLFYEPNGDRWGKYSCRGLLTSGLAFCLVAIVTSRPLLVVRGYSLFMTQLRLLAVVTCTTLIEFAKKKIFLTRLCWQKWVQNFVVFWLENILFMWQVWRGTAVY